MDIARFSSPTRRIKEFNGHMAVFVGFDTQWIMTSFDVRSGGTVAYLRGPHWIPFSSAAVASHLLAAHVCSPNVQDTLGRTPSRKIVLIYITSTERERIASNN